MVPIKQKQPVILLVDDSASNRLMLRRALHTQGYHVLEAEHGEVALDLLKSQSCDLILLDAMMPVMSGFELLRILRRRYDLTRLPIIMVTAINESDNLVEALEQGANDYITKPVDIPVVLARIRTHLLLKNIVEQNEEFISIATHDIKKPLALITDVAEVLGDELHDGKFNLADTVEMMGLIRSAAGNMQRIIYDFLDLKVVERGRIRLFPERFSLNALVRNVASLNSDYAARKAIRLELSLDDTIIPILADKARIEQVLQNLVDNAIKFSPGNCGIHMSTRSLSGEVQFDIRDEGPGFREDEVIRVFEKYPNLSNRPTAGEVSTGLGLAICRQLVGLHGGEIGVRNNPEGVGATFWFRLPVSA